jgi:hypothetical protein
MTRMFLDDWEAQMQSLIAANSSGDISADDFQTVFTNLKDSVIQDESVLQGSVAQTITIDENWVSLSDALLAGPEMFDTVIGGDGVWLIVNRAAGTITTTSTPGYTYKILGAVTIDAATLVEVEATIGLDGVPGNFIASLVGTGGSRELSMSFSRLDLSAPASGVYTLMVRAPNGSTNITIAPRQFGVIIEATNNP